MVGSSCAAPHGSFPPACLHARVRLLALSGSFPFPCDDHWSSGVNTGVLARLGDASWQVALPAVLVSGILFTCPVTCKPLCSS